MAVKTCKHYLSGAARKGAPFRGWAGAVEAWPEKSPPVVAFGEWTQDAGDPHGGGIVTFTCIPFSLVMWGANSKQMRSKDKTTNFGFAGLAPDGNLRIAQLPLGIDARTLFTQGGWQPPQVEGLIERLISATNNNTLNSADCQALLEEIKLDISKGFGMDSRFESTLSSWPMLAPLLDAFNSLAAKLEALKEENKARRHQQASTSVKSAILRLQGEGCEVSQMSIAALLVQGPGVSPRDIKEKVRKLKQILGADFQDS